MRKLFLDDMRPAPDFTWDVVRSYVEFVAFIEFHGVPDVISFDHDLGQEHYDVWDKTPTENLDEHYSQFKEKTGYHCAKWLVENYRLPTNCIVHTMNPVGKQNIEFILNSAYRNEKTNGAIC